MNYWVLLKNLEMVQYQLENGHHIYLTWNNMKPEDGTILRISLEGNRLVEWDRITKQEVWLWNSF